MTTMTLNEVAAPRAALLTSHFVEMLTRDQTVPRVGTRIKIDLNLVVFTDADGNPKTPMTKARFNTRVQRWTQVSPAEAGLLMFFDAQPADDCKQVQIVRVIPNGRACYVVPA